MSVNVFTGIEQSFFDESEEDPSEEKGFEIIYYEYDCWKPCTPNGCCGHVSTQSIGFWLDGISFYVEGAEGGDFPSSNKKRNDKVIEVIEKIAKAFQEKD